MNPIIDVISGKLSGLHKDRRGVFQLLLASPWVLFGIGIFILLLFFVLRFTLNYIIGALVVIGSIVVMIILARTEMLNKTMLTLMLVLIGVGLVMMLVPSLTGALQNLTIMDVV